MVKVKLRRSGLGLFSLAVLICAGCWGYRADDPVGPLDAAAGHQDEQDGSDHKASAAAVESLITDIKHLDQTIFSLEAEAQCYERQCIVPLWDRLLAEEDKFAVLAEVPFEVLMLPQEASSEQNELGVNVTQYTGGGEPWTHDEWAAALETLSEEYRITHSDWHQASFERHADGTANSGITFRFHAEREGPERIRVAGRLDVTWSAPEDGATTPVASRIVVEQATIARRRGDAAFEPMATFEGTRRPTDKRAHVGAVVVHDLNRDGLPDVLLGAANRVMWNEGDWKFKPEPLLGGFDPSMAMTVALVADLNGDGYDDLMGLASGNVPLLWLGDAEGRFPGPPRRIDAVGEPLTYPSVVTAGDIDGDGDLDVWVGQWRELYEKMPEKYWDANDGFGNWLLVNNGDGTFEDGWEAAGLGDKRNRRAFSGSFMDMDEDGDQDLLVVSDFCGVDLYYNDGAGRFTDVTDDLVDEKHAFGMGHTFADFDRDGRLDLFVTGMSSTTARRLEQLGANPADYPEHNAQRKSMGYGNRMYLGGSSWRQPPFMGDVARTQWSWGASALDFDNDADSDIYVANGFISGKSTQDYCTHFWRNDIYACPNYSPETLKAFNNTRTSLFNVSWDGYQSNCLLVNHGGTGFEEMGYLLDVGFTYDARRVVAADMDRDGRVDLLVSQPGDTPGMMHRASAENGPPKLHLYRNMWPPASRRNWIGVEFRGGRPGLSPIGAKITVNYAGGQHVARIVTGDSSLCQHPTVKHFGLGDATSVESIDVEWANGQKQHMESPPINRYLLITPPNPDAPPVSS